MMRMTEIILITKDARRQESTSWRICFPDLVIRQLPSTGCAFSGDTKHWVRPSAFGLRSWSVYGAAGFCRSLSLHGSVSLTKGWTVERPSSGSGSFVNYLRVFLIFKKDIAYRIH